MFNVLNIMLNMIDTFCQFLQTINHEQQLYVIDLEIEIFGIVKRRAKYSHLFY